MVIIYKFDKKLSGEPWEHYLGEVWPKKLSYTKFHKRQNDWKGRYNLAHFGENCKTIQN